LLQPKGIGVFDRTLVHFSVSLGVEVRAFGGVWGRRECAGFLE
jgi:hypothetical protein